ncbi:MAG: type II toxin-antitoxin system VapC family toxin [Candidatus Promineifilaceae bacterium]|nr:type II toxin-antitoxin system VapC family toxin [Candidatus Promineifilaceae bacterium]
MFALDTNTLIYFFKGIGQVSTHLLQTRPQDIAIPSIVLYELEVGIAKSASPQKRRQQLDALLASLSILSFGSQEANRAAQIRADLEWLGTSIGPYDALIAATALANNATLVTHNTREFGRVKNLVVVDWYE